MGKVTTGKTAEQRREQAQQLHDSITTQLETLTSGDGWARFLKLMTGFHRYSLNNVMLIAAQCPDATRVAGFRQWQERGRQVKKGQRAIRIFGYSTKKIEPDEGAEEGEERKRVIFPILSVFDISQTETIDGAEPEDEVVPRLTGDDPTGIYAAVADWLTGLGWTVTREPLKEGRDGQTTTDGTRQVMIESELEDAHAAGTILHEAAHALMHEHVEDYHQHRGIYETEAEAVAYVTAGVLGLDTAANSIGYLAFWGKGDTAHVRATAQNVLTTVRTILDAVAD